MIWVIHSTHGVSIPESSLPVHNRLQGVFVDTRPAGDTPPKPASGALVFVIFKTRRWQKPISGAPAVYPGVIFTLGGYELVRSTIR